MGDFLLGNMQMGGKEKSPCRPLPNDRENPTNNHKSITPYLLTYL